MISSAATGAPGYPTRDLGAKVDAVPSHNNTSPTIGHLLDKWTRETLGAGSLSPHIALPFDEIIQRWKHQRAGLGIQAFQAHRTDTLIWTKDSAETGNI
jgi:hypothetical protein